MKFTLTILCFLVCTAGHAQKNVSKVSLLTSYDFPGKYHKPFAMQVVYEINPLNSGRFNLQLAAGYSRNEYSHLYDGYPGYAACYYTPQTYSTTTSNLCFSQTIYGKTRSLHFTGGVNYVQPLGKKFELKFSANLAAEYKLYSTSTAMFFRVSGTSAPVKYTSVSKYDSKGRPSEYGIHPEVWLGDKLNPKFKAVMRAIYYREIVDPFGSGQNFILGAGVTYTFIPASSKS